MHGARTLNKSAASSYSWLLSSLILMSLSKVCLAFDFLNPRVSRIKDLQNYENEVHKSDAELDHDKVVIGTEPQQRMLLLSPSRLRTHTRGNSINIRQGKNTELLECPPEICNCIWHILATASPQVQRLPQVLHRVH